MLPRLFSQSQKKDYLLLGRTGKSRYHPKFAISPKVRKFHSYVTGLTGRGKSKFLQNCLVQDIMAGRGCAVVDPHGDLAKDVLRSLVSSGYFSDDPAYDRLMYVAPRRRDYVIPFNVLSRPDTETETYEISQRVISAFMRTWARTLLEPPRFQQIMRSSLATLVETGETLCNLYQLLTDNEYRSTQLDQIGDPKVAMDCRAFFQNEFEQWGRERASMMSSTTNKVSALTDNPSIFYMLGQKENQLDIRKIMDEGKVLLVDLGDCDDENFEKLLEIPNEIPSYVETSRRGGHLWMFLEEPIPGEKARLFGLGILHHYRVLAESFPKQGKSIYGSLIRVPFGIHRRSGERYPFSNIGTWREQMDEMMNPKTVPLETVGELQYHPQRRTPRIIYDAMGSKWERVKKAIPVKDYVSEYVTLKGNVGHCPFHDDHKKSFGVNEEGNYWHCFAGCGGGSIIDFYMKMESVDFNTAVNELADNLFGG